MSTKERKKTLVIHPFLFAVFPILFLYADNIQIVVMREVVMPFFVSLVCASSLFIVCWIILKNSAKAGMIVSVVVLFFFSYKHIEIPLILLNNYRFLIGGILVTVNTILFCMGLVSVVCTGVLYFKNSRRINAKIRFFIATSVALFLLAWVGFRHGRFFIGIDRFMLIGVMYLIYLIVTSRKDFYITTRFFNAMSIFLVLFSAYNITVFSIKRHKIMRSIIVNPSVLPVKEVKNQIKPDIYYLIFDKYAGEDTLSRLYFYRNKKFYKQLADRGFYIAKKARSNYDQTVLSLSSSLNMTYLTDIADKLKKQLHIQTADRHLLKEMISSNLVRKTLKQYGYKFVAFAPGFGFTDIRDADYYLKGKYDVNFYKDQLFRVTPIMDFLNQVRPKNRYFLFDGRRDTLHFIFDHLPHLNYITEPKFVFAHFICPHPPFVFDRKGNAHNYEPVIYNAGQLLRYHIDRSRYVKGYRDQLIYLNSKIIEMVDGILAHSKTEPIIILQADHGPASLLYWNHMDQSDMKERFSILNAYHLPDNGADKLYDRISPVNSFRVILNYYFHTDYALLPDKSYFSNMVLPYKFIDVTDRAKAN